jgi:hypothetical protein
MAWRGPSDHDVARRNRRARSSATISLSSKMSTVWLVGPASGKPLERELVCLDGGRRTTQLMRDSLGSATRWI